MLLHYDFSKKSFCYFRIFQKNPKLYIPMTIHPSVNLHISPPETSSGVIKARLPFFVWFFISDVQKSVLFVWLCISSVQNSFLYVLCI